MSTDSPSGLTDKMWCVRCVRCGAWLGEHETVCAMVGGHEWVVPVAAVTEAAAQLSDEFDARTEGRTVDNMAGYYEAIGDFTDLFTVEEETR